MKKYTFKGILLALGLVLATLSMQVGARDAGTDADARADALWQTQLALTNAASTTARDALVKAKLPSPLTALLASTSALVAVAKAVLVSVNLSCQSCATRRASASAIDC
jgi:hypothetical protein